MNTYKIVVYYKPMRGRVRRARERTLTVQAINTTAAVSWMLGTCKSDGIEPLYYEIYLTEGVED